MSFYSIDSAKALDWEILSAYLVRLVTLKKNKYKLNAQRGIPKEERVFWAEHTQIWLKTKGAGQCRLPSSWEDQDLDECWAIIRHVHDHQSEFFRLWKEILDFYVSFQNEIQGLPILHIWKGPNIHYILERYHQYFDQRGLLKDEASDELKQIRNKIRGLREEQQQWIKKWMQTREAHQFLRSRQIHIDGETCLVEVKTSAQWLLEGTIFSESHSGQTVFFELAALKPLRLELIKLKVKERQEELRLKKLWVHFLERHRDTIEEVLRLIEKMDEYMARVRWAQQIKGCDARETAHMYPSLSIENMKHPLSVVKEVFYRPISLEIKGQGEGCILVVSGPNAGGKTLFLKSLGLNLLLALNGFQVCADRFIFSGMSECIATIGDEQSLMEDLSSFTGFVKRLKNHLDEIQGHSYFLFDEIFATTEPRAAAALGLSVLQYLKARGHLVVCTTHLTEIKSLTGKHIFQASFGYNIKDLKPTFEWIWGQPGLSHAFEVAEGVGLEPEIIREAREWLEHHDPKKSDWEKRYRELIAFQEEWEKNWDEKTREKEEELARREAVVKTHEEKLEKKREAWQKRENQLKHELEEYEKKARREIDRKLSEWLRRRKKESEGGQEKAPVQVISPLPSIQQDETPLKKGDEVWVDSLKKKGLILEEKKGRYLVQFDNIKSYYPREQLQKLEKKDLIDSKGGRAKKTYQLKWTKKSEAEKCDVIGYRVQKAIEKIDDYLDMAYRDGYQKLVISHGYGTGELKRGVHDYLKNFKRFRIRYRAGNWIEGSDAVTVVEWENER